MYLYTIAAARLKGVRETVVGGTRSSIGIQIDVLPQAVSAAEYSVDIAVPQLAVQISGRSAFVMLLSGKANLLSHCVMLAANRVRQAALTVSAGNELSAGITERALETDAFSIRQTARKPTSKTPCTIFGRFNLI